jgi:hypothetical protein
MGLVGLAAQGEVPGPARTDFGVGDTRCGGVGASCWGQTRRPGRSGPAIQAALLVWQQVGE